MRTRLLSRAPPERDNPSVDAAALVQADYEPVRGLHLDAAVEVLTATRATRRVLRS